MARIFRFSKMRVNTRATALFIATALVIVAAAPLQGQTHRLYIPALQPSMAIDLKLALVNPTSAEANVTLTARDYAGTLIQSADIVNPVTLTLPASGQKELRAAEIFGIGISGRSGWIELSTSTP